MIIKKELTFRIYILFILISLLFIVVIVKAFIIQNVEGKSWRKLSKSLHQKIQDIQAERGNIYSSDGELLSTSIPEYDLFLDLKIEYLRQNKGFNFWHNINHISSHLATVFKDRSAKEYRRILIKAFNQKSNYFKLQSNVSFQDLKKLLSINFFKLGKYKSGLIIVESQKRIYTYDLLARRTLGIFRDKNSVGLENYYDSILKGRNGKRWVRLIAGGAAVPINDNNEIEPEMGKDLITTLDTYIQEVAENSLYKMMNKNDAEEGCVLIMETKTGKIKAIANLKNAKDGTFNELLNYSLIKCEPGSTFKLFTLLALFTEKFVNLNTLVNLEKGEANVGKVVVHDSEKHSKEWVKLSEAFSLSSNVGFAKLVQDYFLKNPNEYFKLIEKYRLNFTTGIDIPGENHPIFIDPSSKSYSPSTLITMSYGYGLSLTPIQILNFYNLIANDGWTVQPHLIENIAHEGKVLLKGQKGTRSEKLIDKELILQLKYCLEEVCKNGTAKHVFKDFPFLVAGKTGTTWVFDYVNGRYKNNQYYSSFVGYFPAQQPQYTCLVWIKNKENALNFYGSVVAAPVFKDIALKLYFMNKIKIAPSILNLPKDSLEIVLKSDKKNIEFVKQYIVPSFKNNISLSGTENWHKINIKDNKLSPIKEPSSIPNLMPNLYQYSLFNAINRCESMGLVVKIRGQGKLIKQSIIPNSLFNKGQQIILEFN